MTDRRMFHALPRQTRVALPIEHARPLRPLPANFSGQCVGHARKGPCTPFQHVVDFRLRNHEWWRKAHCVAPRHRTNDDTLFTALSDYPSPDPQIGIKTCLVLSVGDEFNRTEQADAAHFTDHGMAAEYDVKALLQIIADRTGISNESIFLDD